MDENTQIQIADLVELRNTHEKRLRVLVLQSAQHGRNTPAEISIEIADIQHEITRITATMARLQIAESQGIEREIRADSTADLGDISRQVSDLRVSATNEIRHVYELLLDTQHRDSTQRTARQRRTDLFYVVITSLLIAILFGIVKRRVATMPAAMAPESRAGRDPF